MGVGEHNRQVRASRLKIKSECSVRIYLAHYLSCSVSFIIGQHFLLDSESYWTADRYRIHRSCVENENVAANIYDRIESSILKHRTIGVYSQLTNRNKRIYGLSNIGRMDRKWRTPSVPIKLDVLDKV